MGLLPRLAVLVAVLAPADARATGAPSDAEAPIAPERWVFRAEPADAAAAARFADADLDDSGWQSASEYAESGPPPGSPVWWRARLALPDPPNVPAFLQLGAMQGEVAVSWNGVALVEADPNSVREPVTGRERGCVVPADARRAGENVLALRAAAGERLPIGDVRLALGGEARWLERAVARRASGFAAASFGFAMELARDGTFPARLWSNSLRDGTWLEEWTLGGLAFRLGGAEVDAADALAESVQHAWPFARARFGGPRLDGLSVALEAFCPIARAGDPYWGALPLGFASVRVENATDHERTLDLVWRFSFRDEQQGVLADEHDGRVLSGFDAETLSARTDAATVEFSGGALRVWTCRVVVAPRSARTVRFCFASSPRRGTGFGGPVPWPASSQLATLGLARFDDAWSSTAGIEEWLPRTGDAALDAALRAYVGSSVQLTRVRTDGTVGILSGPSSPVLDGFWASQLHLVLFPDLERRMIDQVFLSQRRDGKPPAALFPLEEGTDDVDGACAAMLRVFRFSRWHADPHATSKLAANLKGTAAWLAARDEDGDGLTEFAGRRVAPSASFLYVAALERLRDVMRVGREDARTLTFVEEHLRRARDTIERETARGGLWTGSAYTARHGEQVVETGAGPSADQVVGIVLGAVRDDRADLVLASLAAARGRPSPPGNSPGAPLSAVRPWLDFAEAWARFGRGRPSEAITLLRDGSRRDLATEGDGVPHPWIDAAVGQNGGWPWDPRNGSLFFAAVFHGLFGVDRTPEGMLVIAPRAIVGRGWRVRVPLDEGEIEVSDGAAEEAPLLRWSLGRELPLRVRVPGCPSFDAVLAPGTGEKRLR